MSSLFDVGGDLLSGQLQGLLRLGTGATGPYSVDLLSQLSILISL